MDTTPPVVETFTVTPSSVDVTGGPQSITFTVQITDDLAGVDGGYISLIAPDLSFSSGVNSFSATQRISGDSLDGTYSFTRVMAEGFPGGIHHWAISTSDASNNYTWYGNAPNGWSDEPLPPGATPTLDVTGSLGYDA